METKYTELKTWLDKATELRTAGQELLTSDDPRRRTLGFTDTDSNLHYISLTAVRATRFEVSEEVQAKLQTPAGRAGLIEGTPATPPAPPTAPALAPLPALAP